MVRRSKNDTAFGVSVSNALAGANLTQTDLANLTNVSPAYVSQLMTGAKAPSIKWLNLVASTLQLQDNQRKKLHLAAAKDAGYDIDLDLTKE